MGSARSGILSYLEDRVPRIGETLSELVRIPTVNPYSGDPSPSGEAAGQAFAAERVRALGGETQFVPVPDDVYRRAGILGPAKRDWTDRRSLVGRFTFGSGATRIVLNGHMDTIGVADYRGEPFSGRVDDGLVYGRGASDCKGGIVAGLFAVEALRESGAEPDCEVIFESVVDEECNGAGAGTLACCQAGVKGDYCIVLDGGAGRMYAGCQGIATADVTVQGRAGHGSFGGVSAVAKLLVVEKAFERLAAERAESRPKALVNVGVVRAGSAPWTVPDSGYLSANINYEYDEAADAERAGLGFCGANVRARLEELLGEAAAGDEWLGEHPPELIWVKDVPPFRMSDGAPGEACDRLTAAAVEAFREAWGAEPEIADLCAWGDASHLSRVAGMPVIGMGAGEPGTSHTAAEYNRVSNVRSLAGAAALTILSLTDR
ncbi:MAG: M20 family metallopeptidase [Planctomycetota bacterium]|jgi:acetylornithine deacetylase